MTQQLTLFAILALALVMFVAGRWRYDVVALLALLAATFTGVVPGRQAFLGFGDPAVITVAAVFVLTRGLLETGAVDRLARSVLSAEGSLTHQLVALTALVTVLSGFMNNVGALALLMPVAIRIARRRGVSPSIFLMPLAFGSLLGGTVTLIGTPPNIIISDFRAQTGAGPFGMFDFAPVGLGVAATGLGLIWVAGLRLVPRRRGVVSREDLFHIQEYITEVRVPDGSPLVGKPLRELRPATGVEFLVVALIRGTQTMPAPSSFERLTGGDLLVLEADPAALKALVGPGGLELAASREISPEVLGSDEVSVVEAVVIETSSMVYQTARTMDLRYRYDVNLLAVARQGERLRDRLGEIRFRPGDVLLLQARAGSLPETLQTLGCLPLAERGLRFGQPRRVALASAIFGAAVAATALGLLPVQISLVAAAVSMVLSRLVSLRDAYESIDWSILVLLGAMLPVGQAFETTGGAHLLAERMLAFGGASAPEATLVSLLVGSMLLSNLMNNAATAVLMAPMAVGLARELGASADPFLICVAVGSTAAFLTPIGHQSNTLVMGPGGYRFEDYWKLGLPLSVLVVAVATPLILWWWPLGMSPP